MFYYFSATWNLYAGRCLDERVNVKYLIVLYLIIRVRDIGKSYIYGYFPNAHIHSQSRIINYRLFYVENSNNNPHALHSRVYIPMSYARSEGF